MTRSTATTKPTTAEIYSEGSPGEKIKVALPPEAFEQTKRDGISIEEWVRSAICEAIERKKGEEFLRPASKPKPELLEFGEEVLVTAAQFIGVMKVARPESSGDRYEQWIQDVHAIVSVFQQVLPVERIRGIYRSIGSV